MPAAQVSFAGNLTDDPELRPTDGGIARATFRVAGSGRREQEASFFTVVWRDQAGHAAESLSKPLKHSLIFTTNKPCQPYFAILWHDAGTRQ